MLLELDHGFFSHFVDPNPILSRWYEDVQDRRKLLVTIGDSWTWGDSLGTTQYISGVSDPRRLDLVYGRHLQQLIGDCDWINIALPNTANDWLWGVALRFPEIIAQCSYDQVYMSIGFTDMTRDHAWYGYHPESNGKFVDSVKLYERDYFNQLTALIDSPINVVLARNFTDTFEENRNILPFHCDKRWIDISADNWPEGWQPGKTIGARIPDTLSSEDKSWAVDKGIPEMMAVTEFLEACPLHYKKATKHPNEQCHELWAHYIFSQLEKQPKKVVLANQI